MICACAAQGWAQKFIKISIGLFFRALPFLWFLWYFSGLLGLPLVVLWLESWEFTYPALCFLWLCVCSVPSSSRAEKGKYQGFPWVLWDCSSSCWSSEIAWGWHMRKWRKEQNKWGIFSPSFGKLRVSFPTSWAQSKLLLLELFFSCVLVSS